MEMLTRQRECFTGQWKLIHSEQRVIRGSQKCMVQECVTA